MFPIILGRLSYFLTDFGWYILSLFIAIVAFIFALVKIRQSKVNLARGKALFLISSLLFFTILAFITTEAYFRYIYDEPDGLGFLKVNKKWHERHVIHNNYFFRDRDFDINKKEGVVRIGVLGDSITFGGGIERVEDRFSNILEKKLRETGKNVEVYNLGKLGYDTQAEIEEYEKVKHLNFDILVWEYFLNDIQPKGKSTGTPIIDQNSKKGKIVTFISDRSVFFDFVYWRFSQRYQKTFQALRTADLNQYKNREVLESHKKIIADFVKKLKEQNIKTFVIIFPSTFLLGPNYLAKNIHEMMGNYFEELGLQITDLLPDLINKDKNELMASRFDPHPNELVHKIAAEKLFNEISPILATSSPSLR